MRGGIPVGLGPGGKEIPIKATAEGRLEVDADDGSSPLADKFDQLIWEIRALRRVYCEATDQMFDEYPASSGVE